MTEETANKPSFWRRVTDNWHMVLAFVVLLLIIGQVINLNFFTRYEQKEIIQDEKSINQSIHKMAETGQAAGIKIAPENLTESTQLIPATEAQAPMHQEVVTAIEHAPTKMNIADSNSPILNDIIHQLSFIDILLSTQQYPQALQLLSGVDAQLSQLSKSNYALLQTAIASDQQRIQVAQSEREQLIGQLQQLQQHINQQLLSGNEQLVVKETTSASHQTFMEQIKQKWHDAVQVHHKDSNTTVTPKNVPELYVVVMLQLSLHQAEFALERGDWTAYQSALQSVQMWLTTTDLTWLPNANALAQTMNTLVKQPSPFANANIQATHAALKQVKQELAP